MNYPQHFQNLIDCFKLLPGVGNKTAERYAFALLNLEQDSIKQISDTILNIKNKITTCSKCGCLTDTNKCLICDDESRKKDILCVVENQKNVFIFEKLGVFKVKYHVLGGLISPIEGINPEDLSDMVKEVNTSELDDIDILSDHVYRYDLKDKNIKM